jgi:HAE1 family hydrophobic/amphiphilic exporter-1
MQVLFVSPDGSAQRLDQVSASTKERGPVRLFREGQKRKVSVTANIGGRDLGSIQKDIEKAVAGTEMGDCFVNYGGELSRMTESMRDLSAVFILAIILIYMVMAAQFESLIHPLTVMLTVPLGFGGVLVTLALTGTTLNTLSFLGLIIMAGVVVNNGIVLVDYINKLRERGIERDEAIVKGTITKLRAMLLTASVAVVGMLPMAISRTEGSEMRAPIALAVIGGMVAASFLMLFFIPALYRAFDGLASFFSKKETTVE